MAALPPHFRLATVSLDLDKVLPAKDTLQLTEAFPPAWMECRRGNIYELVAHGFKDEFSESQLCAC